jgi:hypothetical protein
MRDVLTGLISSGKLCVSTPTAVAVAVAAAVAAAACVSTRHTVVSRILYVLTAYGQVQARVSRHQ